MPRKLPLFAFALALMLPLTGGAQEPTPEDQFQEDVIRAGVMHVPGVEGIAVDLGPVDSYVEVYLNPEELRVPALLDPSPLALRELFGKLLDDYGIKRVAGRIAQRFVALQAKMGTSTSNNAGCHAGTLGIAAKPNTGASVAGYITNAHVAAASERRLCPNGDIKDNDVKEQLAPGRFDDPHCDKTTTIGMVTKASRIPVDGITAGEVDAAFVVEVTGTVSAINNCSLCPATFAVIKPDDAKGKDVLTCGRVAGAPGGAGTATKGTVKEATYLAWVRYGCGIRAMFKNQILVQGSGFAGPGYSGAVAYIDDGAGKAKEVVGLIFAADVGNGLTLLNPMQKVLGELQVVIDDSRACK